MWARARAPTTKADVWRQRVCACVRARRHQTLTQTLEKVVARRRRANTYPFGIALEPKVSSCYATSGFGAARSAEAAPAIELSARCSLERADKIHSKPAETERLVNVNLNADSRRERDSERERERQSRGKRVRKLPRPRPTMMTTEPARGVSGRALARRPTRTHSEGARGAPQTSHASPEEVARGSPSSADSPGRTWRTWSAGRPI